MGILKKQIYNLARSSAKRILTNNLGKVIEEDDKLICYVYRSRIQKVDNYYRIFCLGTKHNEELANAYDLNKPIYYIIDGERFSSEVFILGCDDCNVEIKNCVFNWGCDISINGNCTLKRTKIRDFSYLNIWATNLKLISMYLDEIPYYNPNFRLNLGADEKIDFISTTIGPKNKKLNISLNAKEANIVNSEIGGFKVDCETQKINMDDDSKFIASDSINIKSDDLKKLTLESPKVIYNGVRITNYKKILTLEKITDPLKIKRMELINVLKQLKSKCDEEKLDQLNKCEGCLNKTSLTRLLKK